MSDVFYAGMIPFFPASRCDWIGWKFAGNTSTVDGSGTLYPLEPNGTTSQSNIDSPVLGDLSCPFNDTFFIGVGDLAGLYQAMVDSITAQGPWLPGEANRIEVITGFISANGVNASFEMQYGLTKYAISLGVAGWSVGELFTLTFNAGGSNTATTYATDFNDGFLSPPFGYVGGLSSGAAASVSDFDWFYTVTDTPPYYETNVVFDGLVSGAPLTYLAANVGSSFIPAIGDAWRGMGIFEGNYTSANWAALLALWGTV